MLTPLDKGFMMFKRLLAISALYISLLLPINILAAQANIRIFNHTGKPVQISGFTNSYSERFGAKIPSIRLNKNANSQDVLLKYPNNVSAIEQRSQIGSLSINCQNTSGIKRYIISTSGSSCSKWHTEDFEKRVCISWKTSHLLVSEQRPSSTGSNNRYILSLERGKNIILSIGNTCDSDPINGIQWRSY